MESRPVQAIFAALADPTRLQMLQRLAEHGPGTATQIAAHLPITRQAVTKHLDVLREAGLVTAQRAGRERRYAFAPESLDEARAWMATIAAQWDQRLSALERYLVNRPGRDTSGSQ